MHRFLIPLLMIAAIPLGCGRTPKKPAKPPVPTERPAPRLNAQQAADVLVRFDAEVGRIADEDAGDCARMGTNLRAAIDKNRTDLTDAFYFKFSLETYSPEHLAFVKLSKENESSRRNHDLMKAIERCKDDPGVRAFQDEYTNLMLGYFME